MNEERMCFRCGSLVANCQCSFPLSSRITSQVLSSSTPVDLDTPDLSERVKSFVEFAESGRANDYTKEELVTVVCGFSRQMKLSLGRLDKLERAGYHLTRIPKGKLGDISKIEEELLEMKDAEDQGCHIMVLQEMSDMVGAMMAYLFENIPGIDIEDLVKMARVTKRAFENGERK